MMESPPSSSIWSTEGFIISDDSGLLLTTNSSISSASSKSGRNRLHLEDSDCDYDVDKSFISQDSLDGMSDIICGENFNTLKKGGPPPPPPPPPPPNCMDYSLIKYSSPIEPPLEFQDQPKIIENFSNQLAINLLKQVVYQLRKNLLKQSKSVQLLNRSYYTTEFIQLTPCHHHYHYNNNNSNSIGRPGSRSSLGSSRLSSSHNSLSVPSAHKVDDSTFITQAVSHDTLSTNQISDLYNVPFDSDVYAVPIDVIKPPPLPLKPRRNHYHHHQQQQQQQQQPPQNKKRRRNTSSGCRDDEGQPIHNNNNNNNNNKQNTIIKFDKLHYQWCLQKSNKRHSVAGSSVDNGNNEPIHMTLQEVRHYLQTLYSSSSDSSDHHKDRPQIKQKSVIATTNNGKETTNGLVATTIATTTTTTTTTTTMFGRTKKNTFLINIKNKKIKDSCDNSHINKKIDTTNNNNNNDYSNNNINNKLEKVKKPPPKLFSFKQTLCNMFRFKRYLSPEHIKCDKNNVNNCGNNINVIEEETSNNILSRALPPLPSKDEQDDKMSTTTAEHSLDFATSIQRVKDYGWYWGPLSGEVAEKILSNEPDGSFIVRDSSDDHYIFSLTFKLNNCIRHVRIDHDQGNFSFGSCTKFKSQTIVEFIENAVEHSRSGRYLFFLHRRPVIGPVRVQLLHPVSRFKQVQSLQHICRFIIHKYVRRDLIPNLPLPRRMIDYLNTPHYYSEHLIDVEDITNNEQTTTTTQHIPPTPAIRSRDHHFIDRDNDEIPINNYIVLNNSNNNINNINRQS